MDVRRLIAGIASAVAIAGVAMYAVNSDSDRVAPHGSYSGRNYPAMDGSFGPGPGASAVDTVRIHPETWPNDFWFNAIYAVNPATSISEGQSFRRREPSFANWYAGPDHLNLARAWAATTGDDDVVVAIIDQEIQWNHYDLVDNIWTNPVETPDNGIDDDGNGLIDDVHGWNFYRWNGDPSHSLGNGDNTFASGSQHGTQMAGILGAQGNNEPWTDAALDPDRMTRLQGSTGVAWDVSIIPLKCFASTAAALTDDIAFRGLTNPSGAVEYLAHLAVNQGVDVSACSMSFTGITSYMVSRLADADILPLTAGNNANSTLGYVTHPGAGGDSLLVSTAVGYNKTKTNYSSFGARIDLMGWAGGASADPGAPYYQSSAPIGWKDIVPGWTVWPFLWTLGWAPVGQGGIQAVAWKGNETSEAATGLTYGFPRPGVLPSPGLNSGTVPMVAGVAALIESSALAPGSWTKLRALVLRSCKDLATIEANSATACAGGSCDGLLGAGAVDAYRAVTLWGKVNIASLPATLSGDVYVSGDVLLVGSGVINIANNTTVWVSPLDLYEDEIEPTSNAPAAFLFDRETEISSEPAVRLDPAGVAIYIDAGVAIVIGTGVTFRSWATYPGAADWEGIHSVGGGYFGTPTILNAAN